MKINRLRSNLDIASSHCRHCFGKYNFQTQGMPDFMTSCNSVRCLCFWWIKFFHFCQGKIYSCSYEPYNMSDISVLEVTNNQYLFFISRVFLLCLNWSMVLYPPLRFSNNIPLQYNVFWLKSNTQHIQKLHASRTKLKLDFIILLKVSKNSFTWINFSHKMTLLTVIEL